MHSPDMRVHRFFYLLFEARNIKKHFYITPQYWRAPSLAQKPKWTGSRWGQPEMARETEFGG